MDDIIEQAVTRNGEQEALEALSRLESAGQLREVVQVAERRHRLVRVRRQIRIYISAVAVVAAVLVVGFQPRYSTGQLYASWCNVVVYEPPVPRGINPAQQAFESALILAQTGKYEEAIGEFALLAAGTDPDYRQDALWQLVLLYLKTGERGYAKETLQKMIEPNGIYTSQAQKLIHELTEKQWF